MKPSPPSLSAGRGPGSGRAGWRSAGLGLGLWAACSVPPAVPVLQGASGEFPETPPAVAENEPEFYPPRPILVPTWWEKHGGAMGAGGAGLVALVGLGLWLRRRRAPKPPPPAHRVVLARLRQWAAPEETPANIGAAARELRRYVQLRLAVGETALTTEELADCLAADGRLDPRLRGELLEILGQCDRLRFGPTAESGSGPLLPRLVALAGEVDQAVGRMPEGGQPDPTGSG